MYSDNFEGTQRHAAIPDQAMSGMLADLHSKGLLDQTLAVLGTEFGRTPRIDGDDGRNEQNTLRCLLARAAIKRARGGLPREVASGLWVGVGFDPGYWVCIPREGVTIVT